MMLPGGSRVTMHHNNERSTAGYILGHMQIISSRLTVVLKREFPRQSLVNSRVHRLAKTHWSHLAEKEHRH